MKTSNPRQQGKPGYVTLLLVLTAGTIALTLSLYAYRQAIATHEVSARVQLTTDYQEKEDAILRSLVALLPNRVIGCMQDNVTISYEDWGPLLWQSIFSDAIDLANARTSLADDFKDDIGLQDLISGNLGDSALSNTSLIFGTVDTVTSHSSASYGQVSPGINRAIEGNYPPPLQINDGWVDYLDYYFPIVSNAKVYGGLASGDVGVSTTEYPNFNLLKYPEINFGYARPGDDFVAKRHWWAFTLDLAKHDDALTKAATVSREFVLSIYEIPSQLAISSSAFLSLGTFASGEDWQNVTIEGGVFAGKAVVEGDANLSSLSSRRGMTLSSGSTIGGQSFVSNPFTPGVRESYQLTNGDFYPVSLASEGGRVAFVPINRGALFFDRFATEDETNTISGVGWNDYSIGARQCAMQLDITECVDATDPTPTELRFSYFRNGIRESMVIPLDSSGVPGLEAGYLYVCDENETYDFGDAVVDLAYGKNGSFAYETGASGEVTFNNARFGDPQVGYLKNGYYRPSYPFAVQTLDSGKICVAVYPQRFEQFLDLIDADDTSINHSLVVNVDYTTATGSINLAEPSIPCSEFDYGLVLEECADLTSFPRGFSLVSNLRTYIGDDFNIVPAAPPAGYAPSGDFYPPVSLFVAEKRYGVDVDPWAVNVSGRIGSLADEDGDMINPLDSKGASGSNFSGNRITVNLKPIAHPAELPPITMMNWLVTIEEVRREFSD